MEAGKTAGRAPGRARTLNVLNPLRAVWWLAANVRFAIVLLVALSVVSLAGVVIPQVPSNIRGDAALEADWLDRQEGRFGFFAEPLDATGLFDVFHQRWFGVLLAVTVVSTGAYVVSRVPGVLQSIGRPRKRVPDRYFQMAPHRVHAEGPVDAARLAELLRERRYKVETYQDGGATYLFADRYQIAQLGTLLTHAAIIVFILASVVSRVDAFESPLFLAEGSTLPVFPVSDPNQIQVQLEDAYAEFAADGQPLDYRADLVISRNGEVAARCSSTVNTPCTFDGYKLYQAAYFGFGAAVTVRDVETGNVIYRETLALSQQSPSPRMRITNADGAELLDETVLLTDSVEVEGETYRAGLVRLSGGRPLTFWLPEAPAGSDRLIVFEPGVSDETVRAELAEGESVVTAGLTVAYERLEPVPSLLVPDFPLPEDLGEGPSGEALLQMTNVVFGTTETSSGEAVDAAAVSGEPALSIVGLEAQAVTLAPGESAEIGGLEYMFDGQAEFAGINVKRDRSDNLVWIGAGLIVVGLMITFWVPRRRLWAKIESTHAALAGQAPSHANYTRELAGLASAAGGRLTEGQDQE
jgi:cytochrome c biogenesis protein